MSRFMRTAVATVLVLAVFGWTTDRPSQVRADANEVAASSPQLDLFRSVSAGNYHTCVVTTGGGVKCWGYNVYGQLGDGTTTDRSTPVDVTGLTSGVTAITAGIFHTCVVTTGGGVKCWGYNTSAQLGDGTTTNRTTPIDVTGLSSGVTAITGAIGHTCALLGTGGVKCWGTNNFNQIGDGTTTTRSTPVDVTGLTSGVTAISGGLQHTCALLTTGGVKCWGYNIYGQIGDGTTTTRSTPVDVTGLTSGVTAITSGSHSTCALLSTGGVKCWGYNLYGQTGDGTTTNRTTPVDVTGLTTGVTAVSSGAHHSCAVLTTGALKCWGYNLYGQTGDGTTTNRTTPIDVTGLSSGVTAIFTGGFHTCTLLTNESLNCWGYNVYGQLGDGPPV